MGSLEGLDGAFAPDSVAASDAFKMVRALGIGSSSSEYDRGFSIVLMSGVGAAEACPAVSANPHSSGLWEPGVCLLCQIGSSRRANGKPPGSPHDIAPGKR